jgi:peptidoglycan/LPS O-acetylase OafA/YrhL
MWIFPLTAALVAALFAGALMRRYVGSRRPYELVWALALLMYAGASLAVTFGVANGWTSGEFRVYWALGAVLNVPFLAAGELDLLIQRRGVRWTLYVLLAFLTAYTIAVVRTAEIPHETALAQDLPSGKEVFGDGTAAHRLPQVVAIPAYLVLLGGTLWSAWRMRGRPALRDRFWGTLLIAFGATIIAGFGSAFAALGYPVPFSISLLAGICVMFVGFLRAARRRDRAPVT